MDRKTLTTLQEVYFDICDLINSGLCDDFMISQYFDEFETLKEFLEEQKTKLEPLTNDNE